MKKRLTLLFSLCLLMAAAAWADPQTLYVNTLPSQTYGGYYVGPAGASWIGAGRSDFGIVCNDYARTTYVPTSFPVVVSTFADLSATRFGAGMSAQYQRTAWLITQMYNANGSLRDSTTVGQIQYAIWELFYGGTPNNYGDWYARATDPNLDLSGVDFSVFRILTPVGPGSSNQEFITRVPEPGMLATLIFGLAGVGLFWRRRRAM